MSSGTERGADSPSSATGGHGGREVLPLLAPGVAKWPAIVVLFLIAALYLLLPARLQVGPPWLLPAAIAALVGAASLTRAMARHDLARRFALATTTVATAAVAVAAVALLTTLPKGTVPARTLLREAGLIWGLNVLVFAVWYWEIDGGGPAKRHRHRHASADFAFPQMQMADDDIVEGWSPGFIDYLFLAFNTSTAFSPTDTLALSRRAKLLMMWQSLISLLVLAVLAARAINTL